MKVEDINIIIAKDQGHDISYENKPGFMFQWFGHGIGFGDEQVPIPNYDTYLDLIIPLVRELSVDLSRKYIQIMHTVMQGGQSLDVDFKCMTATARQHCEVYIKTKDLL